MHVLCSFWSHKYFCPGNPIVPDSLPVKGVAVMEEASLPSTSESIMDPMVLEAWEVLREATVSVDGPDDRIASKGTPRSACSAYFDQR